MARKERPIKIKRYKNSMGSNTNTVYKIKRIVPVAAGIVVLVLAGFLLGKPLLAMLSGGSGSSQPESQSQQVVSENTASQDNVSSVESTSSQESMSSVIEVIPPVVTKTKVYYYTDTAALSTDAGVAAVIDRAKAAGATHLVFDVKNQDGTVMYISANEYASKLQSDKAIDLKAVAERLSVNGLVPVARMYTFMDKLISNVERSTAVMYQGTDTRWLDSSAALGGKAWANPANSTMQEYITALTDEIMSMGVKEFVFAGFHTPTGYSLDKRDFGASMEQVLAAIKSLYRTLEGKISAKGGSCSLQVEYSAIIPEGNYSHYIVHPYQLGAKNIVVTAKGGDTDVAQAVATLKTATDAEEISVVTLWFTDNVNTDGTKELGNYFTH